MVSGDDAFAGGGGEDRGLQQFGQLDDGRCVTANTGTKKNDGPLALLDDGCRFARCQAVAWTPGLFSAEAGSAEAAGEPVSGAASRSCGISRNAGPGDGP